MQRTWFAASQQDNNSNAEHERHKQQVKALEGQLRDLHSRLTRLQADTRCKPARTDRTICAALKPCMPLLSRNAACMHLSYSWRLESLQAFHFDSQAMPPAYAHKQKRRLNACSSKLLPSVADQWQIFKLKRHWQLHSMNVILGFLHDNVALQDQGCRECSVGKWNADVTD